MMTECLPSYLPVIEKSDFAAFRQLMDRDFQNKYLSYADLLAQLRFWATQFGDDQPAPILIRSSDFARAERMGEEPPDLDQLLDYTERLGEVLSVDFHREVTQDFHRDLTRVGRCIPPWEALVKS